MHSTCRPPTRSIWRPTRGPSNPEMTSDPENAAKNQLLEIPQVVRDRVGENGRQIIA